MKRNVTCMEMPSTLATNPNESRKKIVTEELEIEKRYFDLKLKFKDKIDAIDQSRSINASGQDISIAIPTEQSSANFRLPKLNIPVFSGKFEDWIYFKDLFVTTVYSQTWLTNIQKFQYLKDQRSISLVNMTNLRNLVDTSEEVLRGLKAFGTEATNREVKVKAVVAWN
ncbi:uncharacterized protein TNCV_1746751 [Trichonephila clavipes]|nr:uncharacterized protein TNCV_1746751 [Trichonephila clavipes]